MNKIKHSNIPKVLFLLIAVCIIISGCTSVDIQIPEKFDVDLKDQVVFDKDGVVVKAKGFVEKTEGYPDTSAVYFSVENNSGQKLGTEKFKLGLSLWFYIDKCKMSSIGENLWKCPVIKDNETGTARMIIPKDMLDSFGIKKIGTISFDLWLVGGTNDSSEDESSLKELVISNSPEREMNTGQVIFESDDYLVSLAKSDDGKLYAQNNNTYSVGYYVENRTDKEVEVKVGEKNVNGTAFDSGRSPLTLDANTNGYGGEIWEFPYTPEGEDEVLFSKSDVKTLGFTVQIGDSAESEYVEIPIE